MKLLSCRLFRLLSVVLMLVACKKYSLDELLSAPEQIEIDGRMYILMTNIDLTWNPEYTNPVFGDIRIITIDSLTFPSSIDADKVWIIHEDDVWESEKVSDGAAPVENFELKKKIEGKWVDWDSDDSVGVVVHVIVDNDENSYLLRAANQILGVTY